MRIAVLSDIHGNMPALQAVSQDIGDCDVIICCGDLVGYYPDVNEVCEEIRRLNAYVVRGNHDAYVTGFLKPNSKRVDAYKTELTRAKLDKEHLEWLSTLPIELKFCWDDDAVVTVRHASPWDESTYIFPDYEHQGKIALQKNELLILGHTHRPMRIEAENGLILNPGSVGQPRDWNPLASYLKMTTRPLTIEHKRIEYDVYTFQKRLISSGWGDSSEILTRKKI